MRLTLPNMDNLSAEQVRAIESAATSPVSIVTGGPGVGKTYVTRKIMEMYALNNIKAIGCAPTGRAAMRMSAATGKDAMTIHRLLQWKDGEFQHNAKDPEFTWEGEWLKNGPVHFDAVILDEASMVDVFIFNALVSALPKNGRLVIIGDVDQLPSIGPGSVLSDLIASNRIPVSFLTKIFRQPEDSFIPHLSQYVKTGKMPDLSSLRPPLDVRWFTLPQESDVALAVVSAVTKHLPKLGFAVSDIQVLSPQKNGSCGTAALNQTLQKEINAVCLDDQDKYVQISIDERVSVGDRVMQKKNCYDKAVFNGEVGTVTAVRPTIDDPSLDRDYELAVDFTGRTVRYTSSDLCDLQLAYACTVHKSQGGQYPAVVIPVISSHSYMLTRQLMYTAITRAERQLWLIGEPNALRRAVQQTKGSVRRTTLKDMLCSLSSSR